MNSWLHPGHIRGANRTNSW